MRTGVSPAPWAPNGLVAMYQTIDVHAMLVSSDVKNSNVRKRVYVDIHKLLVNLIPSVSLMQA